MAHLTNGFVGLWYALDHNYMGWLVAEWLKHSTANRKPVAGSNPTIAIGDFLSPRS